MRRTTAKRAVVENRHHRAIIYLRLSELHALQLQKDGTLRDLDAVFAEREQALRVLAARLGWEVVRVVVENDEHKTRDGKVRNASAFKRRKITLPDGSTVLRVFRPGFRKILDEFNAGRANALIAEDLDRAMRDPRDLEDFIDIAAEHKINARSESGSLTFTDGGTDSEVTMARIMVTVANKSSRDNQRRQRQSREGRARAGKFGGGPRPFGFEPDGITVRPAEAAIIAAFSERILRIDGQTGKPTTLKQLARELRSGDVPTVTGTQWTAETLRDILLRERNAGILVYDGQEVGDAPWEPIVSVDTFRAVVSLLTNPARNTARGAPPRWQGSGIYVCGKCDNGTRCKINGGRARSPRYICKAHNHIARDAKSVDAMVDRVMIKRLARPDAVELIVTRTPGVDLAALWAEAARIRDNLDSMAADRAVGAITREQMLAGSAAGKERLAVIEKALEASAEQSPLEDLINSPTDPKTVERVAELWHGAPLSVRRAAIQRVLRVEINPVADASAGMVFDPHSVVITFNEPQLLAAA